MRGAFYLKREYPERPLVGVGAVVVRDDGHVLLVRRGQPPRAGGWSLPGGLVELGESLDDAIRREVREECGIEIEVGPLVGTFQLIERDSSGRVRFHYVVLDYLAHYVNGVTRSSSDVEEVAWVNPDRLGHYNLRPETVEMVQRALTMAKKCT